jgi:hypothetical protein
VLGVLRAAERYGTRVSQSLTFDNLEVERVG